MRESVPRIAASSVEGRNAPGMPLGAWRVPSPLRYWPLSFGGGCICPDGDFCVCFCHILFIGEMLKMLALATLNMLQER